MTSTNATVSVNPNDYTKHVTMNVTVKTTGRRTFAIRMAVGGFLIRLAARVIGCHVNIDTEVQR